MTSISHVIPRSAQKSSISCVSAIPPINEPTRLRRRRTRGITLIASGSAGMPTKVNAPSRFNSFRYAFKSCFPDAVSRMKSKLFSCRFIASSSRDSTTSCAPNRFASPALPGEVVKSTTSAPKAFANFTAICPSPPSPTTPTFWPLPTFQCRIGE